MNKLDLLSVEIINPAFEPARKDIESAKQQIKEGRLYEKSRYKKIYYWAACFQAADRELETEIHGENWREQ